MKKSSIISMSAVMDRPSGEVDEPTDDWSIPTGDTREDDFQW